MAQVKGRDTNPELIVRSLVHRLGYRFRLHVDWLPGRPDVVFSSRRKALFVHGCFWHHHTKCPGARIPKSRVGFWSSKIMANKARDRRNLAALTRQGWKYLVVWECEVRDIDSLAGRIIQFLDETER